MQKLSSRNRGRLFDLLSERLAFEVESVALYDCVLSALRDREEAPLVALADTMLDHRDQEREHIAWLEGQIGALGGTPQEQDAKPELREGHLFRRVRLDADAPLAHHFNALLDAELHNNAGWELLAQLADVVGDEDAYWQFSRRLDEEKAHLEFMRQVISFLPRSALFDSVVPMATPY